MKSLTSPRHLVILAIISAVVCLLSGCAEENPPVLPELSTAGINAITRTSAASGGIITGDGGAEITEKGICWSIAASPTTADSKTTAGQGKLDFDGLMEGLIPGTKYYVRAYATNIVGTAYGNELSFSTNPAGAAVLSTTEPDNITSISAVSGGEITDDGDSDITARGVCWSETSTPTITGHKTEDGTGKGIFVSQIAGLSSNMTYYVRAYAVNVAGVSYGNERTFKTPATAPVVTTGNVISTNPLGAVVAGNVTSDGGTPVTVKGICWSASPEPDINSNTQESGSGTGIFTVGIAGLTPNTKYYYRAYAINVIGISYGEVLSFTTNQAYPALSSTGYAERITSLSAEIPFILDSDGGLPIISMGICYGKSQYPTTSDNVSAPSGDFFLNIFLRNLDENTTYYYRAYAENALGVSYGSMLFSFSTLSTGGFATVSDLDNNIYNTVKIGTKLWTRENLKTTKLNDGTSILKVEGDGDWLALTGAAYCWYGNDEARKDEYGALYNWHTVNTGKLCPEGWRVPTPNDWAALVSYMGENAGGRMREEGTLHWEVSGDLIRDSFGFGARAGGTRLGSNGMFFGIRERAGWWTGTAETAASAYYTGLASDGSYYRENTTAKSAGQSIRCIKD